LKTLVLVLHKLVVLVLEPVLPLQLLLFCALGRPSDGVGTRHMDLPWQEDSHEHAYALPAFWLASNSTVLTAFPEASMPKTSLYNFRLARLQLAFSAHDLQSPKVQTRGMCALLTKTDWL
jgi:hypothetical protein